MNLVLDATTQKFQAVLAAAATTTSPTFTASYSDKTTTAFTPGSNHGSVTNSDTDLVAAPASSTQRIISCMTICNIDTVSHTITVKKDVSGTDYTICKRLVGVGQTLEISEAGIRITGEGEGVDARVCEGRLTLETGVPVSTSDQASKTTIYFAPYRGNRLALYDGSSKWTLYTFSQLSIAIGTLTAARAYDVFVYDNAGTLTLELSAAWSSAPAASAARSDALTTQDGVLVKSGATSRRYLGTFYTSSTTTTEDKNQQRFLWNYQNRVPKVLLGRLVNTSGTNTTTTVASATLTSIATDYPVECIIGYQEDAITLHGQAVFAHGTAGTGLQLAIAKNAATNAASAAFLTQPVNGYLSNPSCNWTESILGYEKYFLSAAAASGTVTIYQDLGGTHGETATNDPPATVLTGVVFA